MSNNALYTIEQVENKLIITVEAVKTEQPDLPETRQEEQDKPMDAEQIGGYLFRNAGISKSFRNRIVDHINALVQYELNKAKR